MTDMNGFVNLTQLRKMTQETLKPIITEYVYAYIE
jgi:hypothetical protein